MSIETLTDRELDAAIAEQIFGGPERNVQWYWWKSSTPSLDINPPLYAGPHFSSDIAAAMQVEAEIDRRGLREQYVDALLVVLEFDEAGIFRMAIETGGHDGWNVAWSLVHASAADRCRAALKAIE